MLNKQEQEVFDVTLAMNSELRDNMEILTEALIHIMNSRAKLNSFELSVIAAVALNIVGVVDENGNVKEK